MRVLLDECLPRKLKREIAADVVQTVPEAGWASKKNGVLLRLAETKFDVLLTTDKQLEYQQNLQTFELAIIVLITVSNDISILRPLIPTVNECLKTILPGMIVYIE